MGKLPKKKRLGRSIPDLLALLDNPNFLKESYQIIQQAAALASQIQRPEWTERVEALIGPFVRKWGVVPLHSPELANPDPRRPAFEAIFTGRWGVIPVFPWTTKEEIRATARRIQKKLGKVHRDAQNRRRALIAEWLGGNVTPEGRRVFSRSEVARYLFGRTKGLKRRSRGAIERLSDEEQSALIGRFMSRRLPYREAERRAIRAAQGSEAPASAAVRKAESRYARQRLALARALEKPENRDRIGCPLTMLLRVLLPEEPLAEEGLAPLITEARRWAAELRDALLPRGSVTETR